ncbi:MAG: hypothetical protein H8E72_05600 [Candidatus Marinimicrobia bacterium]|nr:hypothetical protein [Candidatus Neomarinimicrobiota bacterium]
MKIWITMLTIILMCGCEPSKSNVTGSNSVIDLNSAEFVITEKNAYSSSFQVNGTVENTGNTTYYPVWYIEADFYANDEYVLKFGGTSTSITHSLEPGEQTLWTLSFSSSQINESDYGDFAIKNIRAYKVD